MLISSDKERKGRNSEKMTQLLNFLKEETYSDFDTLKQLFRYKAHQPLYLLLDKLEGMGLIQKYVFVSRLGSLTLWGITQDGIAVVLSPEDNIFPARFEPAKLKGPPFDKQIWRPVVNIFIVLNTVMGEVTPHYPMRFVQNLFGKNLDFQYFCRS